MRSYKRMKPMADWQLSYIACLLDGEGWIGTHKNSGYRKRYACLKVQMATSVIVNTVCDATGLGRVYVGSDYTHTWGIASMDELVQLLPVLMPYFLLKGEQAKIALEMSIRRIEKTPWNKDDDAMVQRIFQLNSGWRSLA